MERTLGISQLWVLWSEATLRMHETSAGSFSYWLSDGGASIRILFHGRKWVEGYLEDRRRSMVVLTWLQRWFVKSVAYRDLVYIDKVEKSCFWRSFSSIFTQLNTYDNYTSIDIGSWFTFYPMLVCRKKRMNESSLAIARSGFWRWSRWEILVDFPCKER